jgi:hypothetical protein
MIPAKLSFVKSCALSGTARSGRGSTAQQTLREDLREAIRDGNVNDEDQCNVVARYILTVSGNGRVARVPGFSRLQVYRRAESFPAMP